MEELLALAKENGIELTGERAREVFNSLHSSEELADEELENVAGGGCVEHRVVAAADSCFAWACKECGLGLSDCTHGWYTTCTNCKHCERREDVWGMCMWSAG